MSRDLCAVYVTVPDELYHRNPEMQIKHILSQANQGTYYKFFFISCQYQLIICPVHHPYVKFRGKMNEQMDGDVNEWRDKHIHMTRQKKRDHSMFLCAPPYVPVFVHSVTCPAENMDAVT